MVQDVLDGNEPCTICDWDDYGAVGINDKVTHWKPLSKPDYYKVG